MCFWLFQGVLSIAHIRFLPMGPTSAGRAQTATILLTVIQPLVEWHHARNGRKDAFATARATVTITITTTATVDRLVRATITSTAVSVGSQCHQSNSIHCKTIIIIIGLARRAAAIIDQRQWHVEQHMEVVVALVRLSGMVLPVRTAMCATLLLIVT